VSNCTASATFHQFSVLVEKGIIKSLLATLKMQEARILAVALEGLDNILKVGKEHFTRVRYKYLIYVYRWELRTSFRCSLKTMAAWNSWNNYRCTQITRSIKEP
jgi:UDP-2,3-diacylglucosamine pyrophosphatase LpxH